MPTTKGPKVTHHAATRAKGLAQQVTLTNVIEALAGVRHGHFCSDRECRLFYFDDCTTPGANARCETCRGVRRPWVDTESGVHYQDPRECCTTDTVQVIDPKILRDYKLAGPGPWFQCRVCFRAHGWPGISTTTERNHA